MPTFDWAESPGTSCELVSRLVRTQFGDGYVAAADDGLNPVAQVWDVVLDDVRSDAADEIEAFIKPGLGRAIFDWTPPRHSAALKFCCTSYNRVLLEEYGTFGIRLRFEQRFQP